MSEHNSQATGAIAGGMFPIRTVASLTGVNPVTLRAWERRYNLIRPQRTPKGHRLYTQQDIDRIKQVTALLKQGISIGQVKPLLDSTESPRSRETAATAANEWERYQKRMLRAIEHFDETALDAAYNDALSLYPLDLVIQNLASPLLQTLGQRWTQRATGIAEEHFFSTYLRNKVGARIHHLNLRSSGPLLMVSCLPNEQHEIGMLFFALAAINRGYRVITLGADLPLEQIPLVLEQKPCDAIVLSGSAKPARHLFDQHLPELMRAVQVPVFVGGMITARHEEAINGTGAVAIGRDFQAAFEQMADTLAVS